MRTSSTKAFTRLELAFVLASVSALAMLVLPVLANNKGRTERVSCWNNLRQIGRAFHAWSAEHREQQPWHLPYSRGGLNGAAVGQPLVVPGIDTFPEGTRRNAWFQFLWINQELGAPRILVCPSDAQRRPANTFSNYPGGFAHITMQNQALSYIVGLHTMRDTPHDLLSADRHLRMEQGSGITSCAFVAYQGYQQLAPSIVVQQQAHGWHTNLLHRGSGNILRGDGRVEELSESTLLRAYSDPLFVPNEVRHFLVP